MIERERMMLDREHAQRMNQLNQSMHMSMPYEGLDNYEEDYYKNENQRIVNFNPQDNHVDYTL